MPPTVQVRLDGGPLHGKLLWVDEANTSVKVHFRDDETGVKRTLLYQKEDTMFVFIDNSEGPVPSSATQTGAEV